MVLNGGYALNLKVIYAILTIALVVSLAFNLNYYLNLRVQDNNTINSMLAQGLYIYGYKFGCVAYHLEKYAIALEPDIREEMKIDLNGLKGAVNLLMQGPRQHFYDVLIFTAGAVGTFIEFHKYLVHGFAVINATLVANVVELLRQIGSALWNLDISKNEDPIQYLGSSAINTLIGKCEQFQALVYNQ